MKSNPAFVSDKAQFLSLKYQVLEDQQGDSVVEEGEELAGTPGKEVWSNNINE